MTRESYAAVRVRTGRAKAKARAIIAEVMNDPSMRRWLFIAGTIDGSAWTVVPGGITAREMAEALIAGTEAVRQYAEHEKNTARVGLPIKMDVTEQGDGPHPEREGKPLKRETRLAEDGSFEAPPGEAFTHCGECGGTRWFSTSVIATGNSARLVCAGCGNEIRLHRIVHSEGHV